MAKQISNQSGHNIQISYADEVSTTQLAEPMIATQIKYKMTWKQILRSKEFLCLTLWSALYMTTKYFYITTLDKQIKWLTNNDQHKIDDAQQVFSIMLLSSGCFSIFTGLIIDKGGMKCALIVMAFVSLIGSVCSVITVHNLQWFTMLYFVFHRFFYFASAPLLIISIWGEEKQQMLYGLVLFLSAVFNLSGYLLDDIVTNYLNGDYLIINLVTAYWFHLDWIKR